MELLFPLIKACRESGSLTLTTLQQWRRHLVNFSNVVISGYLALGQHAKVANTAYQQDEGKNRALKSEDPWAK